LHGRLSPVPAGANVVSAGLRISDKLPSALANPLRTNPQNRTCQNPPLPNRGAVMDIERINLIGTQLADLTRRTEALRGYL